MSSQKIKTRVVKKGIKVLDRSVTGLEKTKQEFIRIKDKIPDKEKEKPSTYAENTTVSSGMTFKEVSKKQIKSTYHVVKKQPENIAKAKEMIRQDKKRIETFKQKRKQQAKMNSSNNTSIKKKSKNINSSSTSIKTRNSSLNNKGIKTKKHQFKPLKRFSLKSNPNIRFKASAIKKTITNNQMRRQAIQNISKSIKRSAKNMKNAIKRLLEYSRLLISALVASAGVMVTIILIITMMGMLLVSPLAIFFSNDSDNDGMLLKDAISEINIEYNAEIEKIKNDNPHDLIDISGARTNWKDVLTIYSIVTVKDEELDVVTIDDMRLLLLKSIYTEMNVIEYAVEDEILEEVIVTADENGNLVEETHTVNKKFLKISIINKTAMEMAEKFNFQDEHYEQLNEMLSTEYDTVWVELLTGASIGVGNQNIVDVATMQLGNVGGELYWRWYGGFNSRVEWCAIFVSWCADQAGYLDLGIIPKFASCEYQGVKWFREHGLWQERGYMPQSGDIIFFDWESDGVSDHVGIVEKVEGNTVFTIEGNSNDECKKRQYDVNSSVVKGYGTPLYP